MQIRRGAKTVFRHNFMIGLGVVGNAILVPVFVVLLLTIPAAGAAIGAAVVAGLLWLIWLACWWSKVVIGPYGVTVDNVIVRHVIPWEHLRDIRVQGGLTFQLTDGTSVASATFGSSAAGAITGWRGLRRVREQMLASRPVPAADTPPPRHGPDFQIKIAWWGLAAFFVPLEAVAVIAALGHHKPLF